jgi:hypothetical protein
LDKKETASILFVRMLAVKASTHSCRLGVFFMSKIGAELVHLVHNSALRNQTIFVNPSQIKPLLPLQPHPSYPWASWWGIHPKQQRIFS